MFRLSCPLQTSEIEINHWLLIELSITPQEIRLGKEKETVGDGFARSATRPDGGCAERFQNPIRFHLLTL